jgi:hypothetical protein
LKLGLDPEENEAFVKLLMKRWQGQTGRNALEEIAAATASESVQNVLGAAQEAAKSIKVFSPWRSPLEAWQVMLLTSFGTDGDLV